MTNHLRTIREKQGLTQADVAAALSISTENYNRLENGKTELTLTKMRKLADLYGCAPEDLIAGAPVKRVKVRAFVEAGAWHDDTEWPHEDWYDVAIPDIKELRGEDLSAAEIRGPSMNKIYPEGSVVIVSPRRRLELGKRFVIQRHRRDGQVEQTVKTVTQDGTGRYWLMPESNDPRYQQPIAVDGDEGDEIRVIGKVVYALRKED